MALSNYLELKSEINGWLSRDDMDDKVPVLVTLAEAEFNRRLRTSDMEVRAEASFDGEKLDLPDGFLGLKSVTTDNNVVTQVSPDDLFAYPSTETGTPKYVAVIDEHLYFRPYSDTGTVQITYYERISHLSETNLTNWLIEKHPDLYLMTALAYAEMYNWNDDRLPMIKARADDILEQINTASQMEKHGGRTLRMNSRVNPGIGGVMA